MDKEKDKHFEIWLEVLAKGVLLGGSLGFIAGWIGILPMDRGLFLGVLVGFLAGISFKNFCERKK